MSESPRQQSVGVNGIELVYFEWRPELRAREAPLLLAHATGFHARTWDPVIRRLGERPVIAVDLRSHGRSEKTEITHWKHFGEDLAAFVEELDLRDVIGVGHSMGGHAMVDAAAARPERFRRLVLIDPVIVSPDQYGGGWSIAKLDGHQHPTAKRKRHFPSPEAMIERFRDRPPYAAFEPEALRDYCTHGLIPDEAGEGFVLACLPEHEASVYMTSRSNARVHESIRALEIPVLILRARLPPEQRDVMDFSSSPTWPDLVKELQHGREIHFADRSHFLPMEIPERIAELILSEE